MSGRPIKRTLRDACSVVQVLQYLQGIVMAAGRPMDVRRRVLTPLYVKTVVHAAKSAAWRAR